MIPIQVASESTLADLEGFEWAVNLQQPFAVLRENALRQADMLRSAPVRRDSPETTLNLLLTICAAEQVVADYLVRGTFDFGPVVKRFRQRQLPVRPLLAVQTLTGWVTSMRAALDGPEQASLRRLRRLALELGAALASERQPSLGPEDVAEAFGWPRTSLAERCLKVPSCFRAQDLCAEDCFALAARYSRGLSPGQSVLVLGIRTSGSYMAPLCAGWLSARRFAAEYLTVRPKTPSRHERDLLRREQPEAVAIVDDPPMTGGSFVATAEVAEQCGVLRNQITLLVPRNTEDVLRLPGQASAFERYQRIELPHRQLKVRADLESEELRNWLRGVTGRPRAAIHPVWSPAEVETRAHRRHVKQLFSVSGYGKVVVKGVGTGWFGYPARFAAAALAERTPEVLGFWRGLMASRWVEGSAAAVATQAMAEYVATRQMRLRFAGPRPPAGPFQKDAAYRLAKIIARVHGPLGPLRIASIRALIAGFMADAPACLVDGRMSRDKWIRDSTQGSRLLKCDFEEHAFDKDDLACFDPVYDLAGIVLELGPRREIESTLISRYVALTGDSEAGERKVLARLLYGACALERLSWDVRGEYGTAAWRDAAQRWFTAETTLTWAIDTLLADAFPASPRPASATLWSIDVDGVLEDAGLGFPSTTPAAAAALRHMRESGATVVINTGRSLEEVRLRCDALGLDGGVAEYGAAIWGQRRQRSEVLLSDPQLTALDRIREAAASMADVHVDSRFQASIRARRFVAGHFRALSSAQTARLALVGGEQIRVEPGIRQTDFVAAGCNKATGLARFLQTIGFNGEVVAIGDSASDLPMVRFANRAYAPRHHDEALDSLVTVLSQARQRAVLEAARREHGAMGPWPSSGLSPAAAAVVQLLSLRDQPRWARAWKALGRGMFEVLRV